MRSLSKIVLAGLLMGGAAVVAAQPAAARVGVSIGIGVPGFYGSFDDYDYYRPCRWYFDHNFPAPAHCYRDYYGFYGPDVYVYDGFVYRSHDDYYRWRDRDDFRRWHEHHNEWRGHDNDWRGGGDWHDHGDHHGDWHDHGGDHGDWHDHDHGDHHDHGDDHGDHHDHGDDHGDHHDHGDDHGDHHDHDHDHDNDHDH